MTRVLSLVSASLVAAASAFAQPAPQTITLSAGLQRSYEGTKTNLTQSLEKMPDADILFKATPDVRGFGQIFGHAANSMFGGCAAVKGVENPNQGNDLEKKTTKAEFVKALADAFAFCDDAFSSLTDANAVQMIKQGRNEVARAVALAGLIAHNNELYGTSAVYLRLKGIVPPSTERQQQMRRPGGH